MGAGGVEFVMVMVVFLSWQQCRMVGALLGVLRVVFWIEEMRVGDFEVTMSRSLLEECHSVVFWLLFCVVEGVVEF
jgi:hypothetical protein